LLCCSLFIICFAHLRWAWHSLKFVRANFFIIPVVYIWFLWLYNKLIKTFKFFSEIFKFELLNFLKQTIFSCLIWIELVAGYGSFVHCLLKTIDKSFVNFLSKRSLTLLFCYIFIVFVKHFYWIWDFAGDYFACKVSCHRYSCAMVVLL
jgi:hypothetical protein